jgi:hypothetical protein
MKNFGNKLFLTSLIIVFVFLPLTINIVLTLDLAYYLETSIGIIQGDNSSETNTDNITLLPLTGGDVVSTKKEKLTRIYTWSSSNYKKKYANAQWNIIEAEGSTDNIQVTFNSCYTNKSISYVKFDGGNCRSGFWFEDLKHEQINTKADLLKAMNKRVNSEKNAIAYIVILKNNFFVQNDNGLMYVADHIIKTPSGYLIEVINHSYNIYACGAPMTTGELVYVNKLGKYTTVAKEVKGNNTNQCPTK